MKIVKVMIVKVKIVKILIKIKILIHSIYVLIYFFL